MRADIVWALYSPTMSLATTLANTASFQICRDPTP